MTKRDDVREILAAVAPPDAEPAKRQADLSAAMSAFDAAENVSALQGNTDETRPKSRQSSLSNLWNWIMNVKLPTPRSLMMGGASMAVLAIAVTATQYPARYTAELSPGASSTVPVKSLREPEAATQDVHVAPDAAAVTNETVSENLQNLVGRQIAPQKSRDRSASVPEAPAVLNQTRPTSTSPTQPASTAEAVGLYAGSIAPADEVQPSVHTQGRDNFEEVDPNPIKVTAEDPVSTFSIDVDTASYSFTRAALQNGVLPQKNAVRVEELVNYFSYDYAGPDSLETPFTTDVSVIPTPWNDQTKLMRIGIKGYELTPEEKPRANLVFLLDTSGSMNQPNKLPLLKTSFRMLVDSLDPDDTVSIVVYAGSAGTVLEPTPARDKAKILASLDRLSAGGSTAGGEGIRQAYQLAEANLDPDGVNRVVLATDGDFNVGITNTEELKGFVERKRESGIFLSVLGFGRGNYNDQLMQALAQNGNGQAAYIDTLSEARKILVEEASSTLFPIAKDVKIQVEFNPAMVEEYRLIGYETRLLNREDFNNDNIDAGEIGAGHRVTALYEFAPKGAGQIDPLRYQATTVSDGSQSEYAFVKIRYKQPDGDVSKLLTRPVSLSDEDNADSEAQFAAAVAGFGQLLRGGRQTNDFSYDDVIALANAAKGADLFGYRSEFISLVRLAKTATALEAQRP